MEINIAGDHRSLATEKSFALAPVNVKHHSAAEHIVLD